MAKLVHAHRVGMIAMETMGNRNLDDNRSYAKFSQVIICRMLNSMLFV